MGRTRPINNPPPSPPACAAEVGEGGGVEQLKEVGGGGRAGGDLATGRVVVEVAILRSQISGVGVAPRPAL